MFLRDLLGSLTNLVRHSVGFATKDVRVATTTGRLNDRLVTKRYASQAWEGLCRQLLHVFARRTERGRPFSTWEGIRGPLAVSARVIRLTLFNFDREGWNYVVIQVSLRL